MDATLVAIDFSRSNIEDGIINSLPSQDTSLFSISMETDGFYTKALEYAFANFLY